MLSLLIPKISSLFLLIALGWILGRLAYLGPAATSVLARLLVDVTVPALIFAGMLDGGSGFFAAGWWLPFAGGMAVSLLGFALAAPASMWAAPRQPRRGTFLFLCAIGNSTFLPVPLCHALWGVTGVRQCLLYVVGNNLVLFTLGIGALRAAGAHERDTAQSGPGGLGLVLGNPQILAFIAGALWLLAGVQTPAWLLEPIEQLGAATIPISMVTVGIILSQVRVDRDISPWMQGWVLALKLLALPAVTLLLLRLTRASVEVAPLLLLQASMPCFVGSSIYAQRFGGEPRQAAAATLISTLLCVVTVPLWMALW